MATEPALAVAAPPAVTGDAQIGLASQLGHARQFMPVLPSILATLADGRERALPERE